MRERGEGEGWGKGKGEEKGRGGTPKGWLTSPMFQILKNTLITAVKHTNKQNNLGVSQALPSAAVAICLNPQNCAYLRMGARRRGQGALAPTWKVPN